MADEKNSQPPCQLHANWSQYLQHWTLDAKINPYYPLEYTFGAIIKFSMWNIQVLYFPVPAVWARAELSPEFLNFCLGDNETNRMIYKRYTREKCPFESVVFMLLTFISFRFCLAWWEGVIMLICVHRNRCRRRENGLGWLSLPGKSISEIGNPSSGCPTTANYGQPHGFIAREGRRVFVVTEYWQEIQRRQLPRDRCIAREVVKHECKFCTSLVKCKTQMQRKPTIYSRHVQSKKLTNYDFGKGYFGFSWKVCGYPKGLMSFYLCNHSQTICYQKKTPN